MTRDLAYRSLADLIYKGFLSVGFEMAGKAFVFKTINDNEYDLIKFHAGISSDSMNSLRTNLFFLVFSTFLIDGHNFLADRDQKIGDLYEFFSNIPLAITIMILTELKTLRLKVSEVAKYIEGFCYTTYSRDRWRSISGLPNKEIFTGIKGTDSLGLNSYQHSWVLLNRVMDEEERSDKEFDSAILIASASNSKGAKSMRGKHDSAIQTREERRKKLARKGASDKAQWSPDGWAAPVDTAEELVAELERQMRGIKDKHDIFVENYMKQMEEKEAQAKKEEEDKLVVIRQRRKDEGGFPLTGANRILTAEENARMNANLRRPTNNLMILPSDEVASPEERERYYSKIGSKLLTGRK